VLPFEAITPDADTRGLAAGLTDQILTTLSDNHIPVLSRTDTASLAGPGRGAAERRLGVALLVDGTAQRDGADAHVRVHVADARRQVTLWSKEISASADDVATLQGRVASTVSAVLGCSRRALAPGRGLDDPATLARYLTACDLFANQDDAEGPQQTFQMLAALREVTQKAPRFASAHADLAKFDAYLSPLMPPEQAAAMRAESAREAKTALALDRRSPDAYLAQEMLLPPTRWAEREALLRQGVAADPEWPHTNGFLGMLMGEVGRTREERVYSERAAAADLQIDWAPIAQIAQIAAGQPQPAISQLQDGARLAPTSLFRFRWLLQGLKYARRWGEAEAAFARPPPSWAADPAVRAAEADFLHAARTRAPSDLAKAHGEALALGRRAGGPDPEVIEMLSELGFVDDAFALAERYDPSGPVAGANSVFLFDPLTDNLRRDRRFMRLAARLGLVAYWKSSGHWPDFCSDPKLPYNCRALAG
jgi:TolB-like protein